MRPKKGLFSGPRGCPPSSSTQELLPPRCPFCPEAKPFCALGVCSFTQQRCTGACVSFDVSNEDLCTEKQTISYLNECSDSCSNPDATNHDCESCLTRETGAFNCPIYTKSSDCSFAGKIKCVVAVPIAIKDCIKKFNPIKQTKEFLQCVVGEVRSKCSVQCACSILCPLAQALGVPEDTCNSLCSIGGLEFQLNSELAKSDRVTITNNLQVRVSGTITLRGCVGIVSPQVNFNI